MLNRGLLVVGLAILATQGCVKAPRAQNISTAPAKSEVPLLAFPPEIQAIVDTAELPNDHFKTFEKGKLDIKPDIYFCFPQMGFIDPDLQNLGVSGVGIGGRLGHVLEKFGQRDYHEGNLRFRQYTESYCDYGRAVGPVYFQSSITKNKEGGYYRMFSAMWQGDAYFIVGIERTKDGPRPSVLITESPYGMHSQTMFEIRAEAENISKMMADYLIKNGGVH